MRARRAGIPGWAWALGLSSLGCGEGGGSGPTALTVTGTVRPNEEMTVGAYVDVEAPGATHARVRHGDDETLGLETPSVELDASGRGTLHLLALRPEATTHLEVEATDADGRVATTRLEYRAPPLPEDFEFGGAEVTVPDPDATGWVMGSYTHVGGRIALLLGRDGRIAWYHRLATNYGFVGALFRRKNGNFAFWQPDENRILEVAPTGEVVARFSAADGIDNHEALELPDGTLVVLGAEQHAWDTTPYFPSGRVDATRVDQTILEIAPDGTWRKIYSSWGKLDFSDTVAVFGVVLNPLFFDMCHANAVDPTLDGHYVISCRNTSAIYKIDRGTGEILWRLGGNKSDFTFVDDPLGGFYAQHDARVLPDGRIRLFDNGNGHSPPRSRAVVYELDEVAKTARLVWSWEPPTARYSLLAGSVRDAGPGRTLLNFAAQNQVTEIDETGAIRWELSGLGGGAYRVLWCPELYAGPTPDD